LKTSFALLIITLFFTVTGAGQKLSGNWYGVGKVKKTGDHNSYLSEMILKQNGRKVTGEFNYFFRSAEIKTKISGTYDASYKVLELNARPILNYQAKNANGADCPMEGSFTLKITDSAATLLGQFNPIYEYRVTCPAIDIKFTKSVAKKPKKIPKEKQPEVAASAPVEPVKTNTSEPGKKTTAVAKAPAVVSTKTDSINTTPPLINKPLTQEQKVSLALTERAFDASPVIDVDADSLKVSLYDNGEVDNDTISLFYNRKLVATKQMLSANSLTFTLPLDTSVNEISMLAENLGKIPPNTALAIIYAGPQRFELNLTSTYNKNATIRFRRKLKNTDPKNIN
jgi:hypothetical protein